MEPLPTTINGLKSFIKNVGGKITHPKKQEYYDYIDKLYWYKTFPWRKNN
jgi:shikimate 5-dehydrogenase